MFDKLKSLQDAVGGYIEHITWNTPEGCLSLYCNEEGKITHLPINHFITMLVSPHSQTIHGDVIIFGEADEEGEDTDVPQVIIGMFEKARESFVEPFISIMPFN